MVRARPPFVGCGGTSSSSTYVLEPLDGIVAGGPAGEHIHAAAGTRFVSCSEAMCACDGGACGSVLRAATVCRVCSACRK